MPWTRPAWLAPYEPLIVGAGAVSPEEAMNCPRVCSREDCIQSPRALLCTVVSVQLMLLERLHERGMLTVPDLGRRR